ncbi:hypothetical protein FHG87_023191, partial [Trinorchestia longiramus]
ACVLEGIEGRYKGPSQTLALDLSLSLSLIANKGKLNLPSDLGLHRLVLEAPNEHDRRRSRRDCKQRKALKVPSDLGLRGRVFEASNKHHIEEE